ncbi:MAG: ParB/RepB/Spo0J family partition protein [Sedimentisphaerales bacterium]|jgi:ParB/RepB/Spo0J family partition protein
MSEQIKSIALSKLVAHPDNPNVMSGDKFRKLVHNIERTGLYEPIVVRPHPASEGKFQIINGHHRVQALEKLGRKEVNCVVWNVDDRQTAILLTTLNRLGGTDEPAKKIELLRKLKEKFDSAELAKLLPNTRKQIEQLTNLKLNAVRCPPTAQQFAIPLVFFVNSEQNKIIENALSSIENQVPKIGTPLRSVSRIEMTKSQRRAEALTRIAEYFLSQTNGGLTDAQK